MATESRKKHGRVIQNEHNVLIELLGFPPRWETALPKEFLANIFIAFPKKACSLLG